MSSYRLYIKMGPTGFSRLVAQELKEAELYGNQISQYPLFTREEEQTCFREVREGATEEIREKARKRAVVHNLRLVLKLARTYMCRGLSLDDLIQEGTLGLITAVMQFDYRKGFRFSTYAVWWIGQTIARAIQNQVEIVRIPVHAHESQSRLRKALDRLVEELGGTPSDQEIAFHLGEPESRIIKGLRRLNRRTISLDDTIGGSNGSRSTTRGDLAVDLRTLSALSRLEAQEEFEGAKKRVAKVLGFIEFLPLSDRDRAVFKLYLGLEGDRKPMTYEAIAGRFGVSREWIRQIYSGVWDKLEILGSTFDGDSFPEELDRMVELQTILGDEERLPITPAEFSPQETDRLLAKLVAYQHKADRPALTMPQVVSPQIAEICPDLTAEIIIRAVANHYDLAPEILLDRNRKAVVAEARQVAMYLIRHDLGKSFVKIAKDLKRKDHTTVIHGCQVVEQMVERDKNVRDELDTIRSSYLPPETDTEGAVYEPQLTPVSGMVLRIVGQTLGASLFNLLGSSREESCVLARHISMYLLREDFNWSFGDMAVVFGKADASSVWRAHKQIAERCETDALMLGLLNQIRSDYTLGDYPDFLQLEKSQTRLFPGQEMEAREFRRRFEQQLKFFGSSLTLAGLDKQQLGLVEVHYGLKSKLVPASYAETGKQFGFSWQQARRIIADAWKKLRETAAPITSEKSLVQILENIRILDKLLNTAKDQDR